MTKKEIKLDQERYAKYLTERLNAGEQISAAVPISPKTAIPEHLASTHYSTVMSWHVEREGANE